MKKEKLYHLDFSGVLANEKAIRVEPISGDLRSFRFVVFLKKIVEKERGKGMSLDRIITTTPGQMVFHEKKDYDYFMNKAKEEFKRINSV